MLALCPQAPEAAIAQARLDDRIDAREIVALHLLCSSKKGFSAKQLQRNLGLGSYRTAWFMAHRIRFAMTENPVKKLTGIVESDESYFGGTPKRNTGKRGLGTKKAAVMVLVERGGSASCQPLENTKGKTLRAELKKHVSPDALLMTDELPAYRKPGKMFSEHDTVNHRDEEYARTRDDGIVAHVNTAECFFSLMKRGHYGVYHSWSKKHLHRYCTEFGFRFSRRKITDTERTEAAIQQADGMRLLYKNSDRQA